MIQNCTIFLSGVGWAGGLCSQPTALVPSVRVPSSNKTHILAAHGVNSSESGTREIIL